MIDFPQNAENPISENLSFKYFPGEGFPHTPRGHKGPLPEVVALTPSVKS